MGATDALGRFPPVERLTYMLGVLSVVIGWASANFIDVASDSIFLKYEVNEKVTDLKHKTLRIANTHWSKSIYDATLEVTSQSENAELDCQLSANAEKDELSIFDTKTPGQNKVIFAFSRIYPGSRYAIYATSLSSCNISYEFKVPQSSGDQNGRIAISKPTFGTFVIENYMAILVGFAGIFSIFFFPTYLILYRQFLCSILSDSTKTDPKTGDPAGPG